jgi:hypothetical protein
MVETPFDALERELVAAATRQAAAARTGARRWPRRRRRAALIAIAATLALAVAAWAATSLLSIGPPVPYRHGAPVAGKGIGAIVPGSVQLLADDVADPAGGLPWGLRTYTTTRQFGCLQIGRVYQGKLGLLDRDRTFHELRPGILAGDAGWCMPLDGAGHAFLALHLNIDESGRPAFCGFFRAPGHLQRCGRSVRTIDVGFLGPDATRIAYRVRGRSRTAATLGADGGYLVVQRWLTPRMRTLPSGARYGVEATASFSPASQVITRVDYRDGSSCAVHVTTRIDGSCPHPPGFVPIPQPHVADVRAHVRAFAAPGRRGVRIRFRARQAVVDGRTGYTVIVHRLGGHESFGKDLERDVAAGALVRTTIDLPRMRPGHYRVVVSFRTQPPRPRITGTLADPGVPVGSTTFDLR